MAKIKAFTKFIGPIGSSSSEGNTVHQVSPAWVLTFVRWDVRDTLRAIPESGISSTLYQTRKPLVVENDCIQVSVTSNKATLTPSLSATLLATDTNYETAVAPGDFILVNMLNSPKKARVVANKARGGASGAINGPNDGFKGLFKVQSVRKVLRADPQSGTKLLVYKVTGFAFTEFNNSIYYNPYLLRTDQTGDKDNLLFISNLGKDYANLISQNSNPRCQDLIKLLIQSFIGVGISDRGATFAGGSPITANTHFYIPPQVGELLGQPNVKAAKDIYNYLFGIQKYSGSPNQNLTQGMNPNNLNQSDNRFYNTSAPCDGQTLLKAEYWNQVKAWAIINQYVNSPLNELYTCFRLSPSGSVMPTVVMRQIPFTSEDFGYSDVFSSQYTVTRFLELPRWQISSALITDVDIGREEAARINFVQYYGQVTVNKPEASYSSQTAAGNYVYDINDVSRSGLRPYVITTQFEDLSNVKDAHFSRKWAQITGDALIGGHLKLNGSITCAGIVDPIAVGDNLEYDNVVYHIEEITHSASINPGDAKKTFRTTLRLSNGVSVGDSLHALAYPEMTHTRAYQDRKSNYVNGNKALPGVSEEQDVVYRPGRTSPSLAEVNQKDKPFAQPGQVVSPINDEQDDE